MTVKQLIAILKKHPGNLTVYVDGYEDGLHDLKKDHVYKTEVVRDVYSAEYSGEHERAKYFYENKDKPKSKGLIISRMENF